MRRSTQILVAAGLLAGGLALASWVRRPDLPDSPAPSAASATSAAPKIVDPIDKAAVDGTPESVDFLAELAARSDPSAARAGAALGRVTNPASAERLAKLATGDGPILVRANAARALAGSGSASQASALANLVADDAQPLRVRQESALALARIGGPDQVPLLTRTLDAKATDKDSEQLRISIVQALGGIHTPEARAAVARHAARELSPNERAFVDKAR